MRIGLLALAVVFVIGCGSSSNQDAGNGGGSATGGSSASGGGLGFGGGDCIGGGSGGGVATGGGAAAGGGVATGGGSGLGGGDCTGGGAGGGVATGGGGSQNDGGATGGGSGGTCSDLTKNGNETDVDCGGGTCPGCDFGKNCTQGSDCASTVCFNGTCGAPAPSCGDTMQNGSETDIDCGGGTCAPCADTKHCAIDSDCSSKSCDATLTCVAASCSDTKKNGNETDIDCGGITCPPCAVGDHCFAGTDCTSAVCDLANYVCLMPNCADGTKNGSETDLDCGGGTCSGCAIGKHCQMNVDCGSGYCANLSCAQPSCSDGVQNGTETGVDCGGSCNACRATLLLAASATSVTGGTFDGASWTTTPLSGTSDVAPAIAFAGNAGVGLFRDALTGNLLYTTVSTGMWSTPAQVAAGVTTRAHPAIINAGASAAAVFQGTNYFYYFAQFSGGTWSPTAEAANTFGPNEADLAVTGTTPVLGFINGADNNNLYAQGRNSGTWGSGTLVSTNTAFAVPPSIVALDSGAELLMVWARSDNQVMYATRTGGAWSAGAAITNAYTNDRAGLAALPGGQAVIAFRGQDGNLYWSQYTGGGSWSTVAPLSTPNATVSGTPAIAAGAPGAGAELAWVDGSNGGVYHARLGSNGWSAPALVLMPASTVAIATGP
ncbi:MAG: hypothetical protein QM723_05895 [Myxococcaceae bacterium]